MPTTPSGLQYEDTEVGTGAEAKAGQHVHVHYTGWLYNDGVQGAKFDSSRDRNDPSAISRPAIQRRTSRSRSAGSRRRRRGRHSRARPE